MQSAATTRSLVAKIPAHTLLPVWYRTSKELRNSKFQKDGLSTLQNFRHALCTISLSIEAGSFDAAFVDANMVGLPEKLSDYDSSGIFNVDETGQFFKLQPKRTYICKTENCESICSAKAMNENDRITAYVWSIQIGVKVSICVIDKPKNPRCFRIEKSAVPYLSKKMRDQVPLHFVVSFKVSFCRSFHDILFSFCFTNVQLRRSRHEHRQSTRTGDISYTPPTAISYIYHVYGSIQQLYTTLSFTFILLYCSIFRVIPAGTERNCSIEASDERCSQKTWSALAECV